MTIQYVKLTLKPTLQKPTMKENLFLSEILYSNVIFHKLIFQTNSNRFGSVQIKHLIDFQM